LALRSQRAPEVRTQMERQGLEPTGGSPQQARSHLQREIATWKRVIQQAGIKPQ
jgi:tripartite-type tricarboxylate transporter receptor subunit TctC